MVGSQEHGETISHVPGPDGVVIGVKDVGLAQAVLQRRSGNDRIVHRSKVTCDALCGRGVWSRSASRRLLRECAPGGRADAADALAEVGVERGAHACRAGERRHTGAGLSFLWTGVTIGDFSGGGTAFAGSLAEGDADVGAGQGWSGLVRAGCGEGECDGSRLGDSEKSPIVTLSAVRGAGRADRERTDEDCVRRTRGGDLSRLQESTVLAGYRSPRHTAGVRRSDVAGIVRHPAVSGCFTWAAVRAAVSCRRSLSTPGMDRSPPRLSHSDSRLHAVKLTEPDSITILSAYDST